MEDEAERAAAEGRSATAFVRYCIAAQTAISRSEWDRAASAVEAASRLEPQLDPGDWNVPQLRNTAATLAERQGRDAAEVARILGDGAHHWYRRLGMRELSPGDFDTVAGALHDHMRRLARYLLMLDRPAEALVAFEAGRALVLGRDVDSGFIERVVRANPFAEGSDRTDTGLLERIQETLAGDEVALVFASLPPNLVAFVVDRGGVTTTAVPVGRTPEEARETASSVRMLPQRLGTGVGVTAVPESLRELARALASVIGARKVVRVSPHTLFHDVPWRALLRDAGLPWEQLAFSIRFGLLLDYRPLPAEAVLRSGLVTLGHGGVEGLDFRLEAQEFAAAWGVGAAYEEPCTAEAVARSLVSGKAFLLSCHGLVQDGRLYLRLAGGDRLAVDCVPDGVSCPLCVFSACSSGLYGMGWGDDPAGLAPLALRRGVRRCVVARWPVNAHFARVVLGRFAADLRSRGSIEDALAACLAWAEQEGWNLWRDLACLEVLARD